jgi:hypothetical protein
MTLDHLARHTEAVRQLDRAIERIMGIETVPMGGDNLAILLCSHFDDPDDGSELDDTGWSQSATDAYDEVKQEIAGLFVPVRIAIAAMLPVWQPIESAPRDGTWFLGWTPHKAIQGRIETWRWDRDEYEGDCCVDAAEQSFDNFQPEFWQPLSTPPENNNDH